MHRLLRRRRLGGPALARSNLAGPASACPAEPRALRRLRKAEPCTHKDQRRGPFPARAFLRPVTRPREARVAAQPVICADSADPGARDQRYSWVEWGVLFRDDKEGQPRFASAKWVDDLVAVNRTSPMRVRACACLWRARRCAGCVACIGNLGLEMQKVVTAVVMPMGVTTRLAELATTEDGADGTHTAGRTLVLQGCARPAGKLQRARAHADSQATRTEFSALPLMNRPVHGVVLLQ